MDETWNEQQAFAKAVGKLVEKASESMLQNVSTIALKDPKYYKHVHALLERQFKRWCDAGELKAVRNLLYAVSEILQASQKQHKAADKYKERLKPLVVSILDALSDSIYQDHARRILLLWRRRGVTTPEVHDECCNALRVPLGAPSGVGADQGLLTGSGGPGAAAGARSGQQGDGRYKDDRHLQGSGDNTQPAPSRDPSGGLNSSHQPLPPPPTHEVPPPAAIMRPPQAGQQPQAQAQALPPSPPTQSPPPARPPGQPASPSVPPWQSANIPGLGPVPPPPPGLGPTPTPPWPALPPTLLPPPGWPPGLQPPQLPPGLGAPPPWGWPAPPFHMHPPPGWPPHLPPPQPPQQSAPSQPPAGLVAPAQQQSQPQQPAQPLLEQSEGHGQGPPQGPISTSGSDSTQRVREFGRRKSRWAAEGEAPAAGGSTDGEGQENTNGPDAATEPTHAPPPPPPPPSAPDPVPARKPQVEKLAQPKPLDDDNDLGLLYDPFAE